MGDGGTGAGGGGSSETTAAGFVGGGGGGVDRVAAAFDGGGGGADREVGLALIVKFASASSSVIAAAGAGLDGFVAKHKMKRGGKWEGLVSYET